MTNGPTRLRCVWLCILTLSALGVTSLARAAGDETWYGAIKASISEDTIAQMQQSGIGTGQLIEGQLDGALEDRSVDDYTAGLSVAIGRRSGYWNMELEYTYRYRTDWDMVASTPSIRTITNVFSDVETNTLMLNAARRGSLSQYWSWELGAGLGLTLKSIDSRYIERATDTDPQQSFGDNDRSAEFSWSVFAGATRALGGAWTFNARLRYLDMGDLEAGPFPQRDARVSAQHSAMELQFSFERDF